MFWIIFFRNKISNRLLKLYYLLTLCIIVVGTWLKLNEDPLANLLLMTGLGLTLDIILMSFYKNGRKPE